jgi:hypothetical protein
MKAFYLILFLLSSLSASDWDIFYSTTENILGKKQTQEDISAISYDQSFIKFKKMLSTNSIEVALKVKSKNSIKKSTLNLDELLSTLQTSFKRHNTLFEAYIGLEIIHQLTTFKNIELNKKYAYPFAKRLSQSKICKGYFYYGVLTKKIYDDRAKAITIFTDGLSECGKSSWFKHKIYDEIYKIGGKSLLISIIKKVKHIKSSQK